MMIYTFFVKGTFTPIYSTTYEAACKAFSILTTKANLDSATVVSVARAA